MASTRPQDDRAARLGGPAFDTAAGVTVRDYFAANAPQPPGWAMVPPDEDGWTLDAYAAQLASWRFAYASNMMRVRAVDPTS